MVDQTLPEIVAVHERNKAKRHEAIKEQKKKEVDDYIQNMMPKLSELNKKHNECNDPAIKNTILKDWQQLVKLCAKKIEELK